MKFYQLSLALSGPANKYFTSLFPANILLFLQMYWTKFCGFCFLLYFGKYQKKKNLFSFWKFVTSKNACSFWRAPKMNAHQFPKWK